jgi:hypothetical protein
LDRVTNELRQYQLPFLKDHPRQKEKRHDESSDAGVATVMREGSHSGREIEHNTGQSQKARGSIGTQKSIPGQ